MNSNPDLPGTRIALDLSHNFEELERGLGGGVLGLAFETESGIRGGWRENAIFPTASSIKVAIVAALELAFDAGICDPRALWKLSDSDRVGGSGVLAQLKGPMTLNLDDLATLALVVSDNSASNACLAAVGGPANINSWLERIGATSTRIHRPIRFQLNPGDPPFTATGTPSDFLRILEHLPSRVWERMEGCSTSFLARYLPCSPFALELGKEPASVRAIGKPGAIEGVRNDVGRIEWPNGSMRIAVMTKDVPDARWTAENIGEIALGRAVERVMEHVSGGCRE
jgi:beta-lactamase class A